LPGKRLNHETCVPLNPSTTLQWASWFNHSGCLQYTNYRTRNGVALQADTPSELIVIDNNYKSRVESRRELIAAHPSTILGAIPEGHPIVDEVYTYLLSQYLPSRYPSMFSLSTDGKTVHNHVTHATFPCLPPRDPLQALRILGETVEDDMFLLVNTNEGHRAVAFVCCHPAGFDPSTKLGLVLKDIHAPVPSYEKIGLSMERYFSKLEVGKSVKRMNVS